jgi:predicted TIM-barrel fold metal-dependent hydrolase
MGKPFCTPDDLLRHYDRIGVEKGCLLPVVSPESVLNTQSNEEILRFCATHPDRFVPFCNLDPRNLLNRMNSPFLRVLQWYKEKGCKVLGELTCNLRFLDERVQALFAAAEEIGFSVTFHMAPFEGENYGLVDIPGMPGLEESLKRFPKLRFFGHSQAFWSEIGQYRGQQARFGYPSGPVKEGRIAQLMRKYPNLYGDLSAGSGNNALARDLDYAGKFLTEFQDRIMYGVDICAPKGYVSPLDQTMKTLLRTGRISTTVYKKVARENQIRILGLEA